MRFVLAAVVIIFLLWPPLIKNSFAQSRNIIAIPPTWNIVSKIKGTWHSVPRGVPSRSMPDGPLLGNGDLGAVLGGRPEQLTFYIGKSDFFGVERGHIMPVGRLQFSIEHFRQASCRLTQDIGPAIVTGRFVQGTSGTPSSLSMKAWVARKHNLLVIELRNTGKTALAMSTQLMDAWGTTSGNQFWHGNDWSAIWVSPDSVRAYAGNRLTGGTAAMFNGRIAFIQIFDKVINPIRKSPTHTLASRYGWKLSRKKTIIPWHAVPVAKPSRANGGWHFRGGGKSAASLGVIQLPQKAFTVTAWIRLSSFQKKAFIFTALANPYPPRSYPYRRGLALGIYKGKLFARLNRTVVKAPVALPLHKWLQIAVTYDGQQLVLRQNGTRLASINDFPTAVEVMGADKGSIHTGDPDIPFDGCSPEGLMVQRVLGAPVTEHNSRLFFRISPDRSVTALLSVVTDRNKANYFQAAQRLVKQTDTSLARLRKAHLSGWKNFWNRSFIKIPQRTIEAEWYGSLYDLACCSRPGCDPPGLWGNFITAREMGWQGDYHLDYNYQAPFWCAYPTNHVQLAANYEMPLLENMSRAAAIAKHAGYHGLYEYTCVIPTPGWDDDPSHFCAQKIACLFAAVDIAMRWRYTCSPSYAKRVYPYLRGIVAFWDHYLVLENGRYVDRHDAPDEWVDGNAVNPATTLAFLKLIYPTVIEMSRVLHVDAAQRPIWRRYAARLSPLPIVPADTISQIVKAVGIASVKGRRVIRFTQIGPAWLDVGDRLGPRTPVSEDKSSAGMYSLMSVFPAWQIGLESNHRLLDAGLNCVRYSQLWYDLNDTSSFYPAAACVGYNAQSLLRHMKLMIAHFTMPNFAFTFAGGGTENFSTIPTTICCMFLQSYQKNIHIFPDWPIDLDAQFGNLLACGNFLISSEIRHGHVTYIRVSSRVGKPLNLVNPWSESDVLVKVNGHPAKVMRGKVLHMNTRSGEEITLTSGG